MIVVPPVEITDAVLISSSVPDTVGVDAAYASGQINCVGSNPSLGQTCVVAGVTFTIVASGTAFGNVVKNNNPVTFASNITTALNRDIGNIITAANNGTVVVTVTADDIGTGGNDIECRNVSFGTTIFPATGYLSGGADEVVGNVEWSSATIYDTGDRVVVSTEHNIYESLRNTNTGNNPADNLTGASPYWLYIGKTNRWRMLDNRGLASTVNPESIIVVLAPGQAINSIAILGVTADSISINMQSGGLTVYNQTVEPTSDNINLLLEDLPDNYSSPVVTLTLINADANVECSMVVMGLAENIGTTRPDPTISLIDYSVKSVNAFGDYSITERDYSRRLECEIGTEIGSLGALRRALTRYRNVPVLWIASELYSLMILYGFAKDFSISAPNNAMVTTSLTIEGMVGASQVRTIYASQVIPPGAYAILMTGTDTPIWATGTTDELEVTYLPLETLFLTGTTTSLLTTGTADEITETA